MFDACDEPAEAGYVEDVLEDSEVERFLEWKLAKVDRDMSYLASRRRELARLRASWGDSSMAAASVSSAPVRPRVAQPIDVDDIAAAEDFFRSEVPVRQRHQQQLPEEDAESTTEREVRLHDELQAQLREIHSVQARVDYLRNLLTETETTVRTAQRSTTTAASSTAAPASAPSVAVASTVPFTDFPAEQLRHELEDVLAYSRVAVVAGRPSFATVLFQRLLALNDAELPAVCEGLVRALPTSPMPSPASAAAVSRMLPHTSPLPRSVAAAAAATTAAEEEEDYEDFEEDRAASSAVGGYAQLPAADEGDKEEVEEDDDDGGESPELNPEELDELAREHNEDILSIEIVSRKLELFLLALAESAAVGPTGYAARPQKLLKEDCERLTMFIVDAIKKQGCCSEGSESLASAVRAAVFRFENKDIGGLREALVRDIDDLLYDELIFSKALASTRSSEQRSTAAPATTVAAAAATAEPAASSAAASEPAGEAPVFKEPRSRAAATGRFSPIAQVVPRFGRLDAESVKSETDVSRAATKGSESLPSVSDTETIPGEEDDDGTAGQQQQQQQPAAEDEDGEEDIEEEEDREPQPVTEVATTEAPTAAEAGPVKSPEELPAGFAAVIPEPALVGNPDGEVRPDAPSHAQQEQEKAKTEAGEEKAQ